MGEKIRDIHPIKIGSASLMIELNEGYTPSDGRLIHIQNKKYRFLLKEPDFHHLCAMVMRSWSEFEYIKNKKVTQRALKDFKQREPVSRDTIVKLKDFTNILVLNNITYRVLDLQNKLITVCVKEHDKQSLDKILKNNGGIKQDHPYGEKCGYIFLYLMTPFMLYKLDDTYIEVFCQLPCASLTPKNWIPLDRKIQSRLWTFTDTIDGISWADSISRYIFHLCWAIFHNNGFSPFERAFLSENKNVLDKAELKQCLLLVFFNYTELLIDFLRKEEFDSIIPSYYHFIEY